MYTQDFLIKKFEETFGELPEDNIISFLNLNNYEFPLPNIEMEICLLHLDNYKHILPEKIKSIGYIYAINYNNKLNDNLLNYGIDDDKKNNYHLTIIV